MKATKPKFAPGSWLRTPARFPLRQHRARVARVVECEPGPYRLMRLDVCGKTFACTADEIGRKNKLR